jgi:serine/threonine protein kinase
MHINDYVIDGKLAEGGLGEVIAAREKTTGRRVVLKRPMATGQQAYERTRDEGRLGLRVNGTAFVQTFGQFEHDGVPHLVIEHLDGVTVFDLWRNTGALSFAAVAKIGAEVCQALAVLHILRDDDGAPLGAIHRDISSRNVMVESSGRVRVIDLGAAYSDAADRSAQSGVGVIIGTMPYLPPELLDGGEDSTARDVWAVGVTLLEAAAGNPFTRKPARAEADVDALMRVKRKTRDPFSDPAVQALEPRLLSVLKRMLTTDPDARIDAMSAGVQLAAIYAGSNAQAELARRVGQVRQLPAAAPKPMAATAVVVPATPSPMGLPRTELARQGLDDGPTIVDPQPRKPVVNNRINDDPTLKDHGGLAQPSRLPSRLPTDAEGPTGVGRAWPKAPALSNDDRPLFDLEPSEAPSLPARTAPTSPPPVPTDLEPTKSPDVETLTETRPFALRSLAVPSDSGDVFTGNHVFEEPPQEPRTMAKRLGLTAAFVAIAVLVLVVAGMLLEK